VHPSINVLDSSPIRLKSIKLMPKSDPFDILERKRNGTNVVMKIFQDLKADKGGLGCSDQELQSMDKSGESIQPSTRTNVVGFSPRSPAVNEMVADESSPLSIQTSV